METFGAWQARNVGQDPKATAHSLMRRATQTLGYYTDMRKFVDPGGHSRRPMILKCMTPLAYCGPIFHAEQNLIVTRYYVSWRGTNR